MAITLYHFHIARGTALLRFLLPTGSSQHLEGDLTQLFVLLEAELVHELFLKALKGNMSSPTSKSSAVLSKNTERLSRISNDLACDLRCRQANRFSEREPSQLAQAECPTEKEFFCCKD